MQVSAVLLNAEPYSYVNAAIQAHFVGSSFVLFYEACVIGEYMGKCWISTY